MLDDFFFKNKIKTVNKDRKTQMRNARARRLALFTVLFLSVFVHVSCIYLGHLNYFSFLWLSVVMVLLFFNIYCDNQPSRSEILAILKGLNEHHLTRRSKICTVWFDGEQW